MPESTFKLAIIARGERLPPFREEIRSYSFWKAVRCEFLVTLLYVFTGCGALTVWLPDKPPTAVITVNTADGPTGAYRTPPTHTSTVNVTSSAADEIKVAFAFGLGFATLSQCVGHISGAHLNPAVSVAMLVTRNVSVLRAGAYVLVQCLGGIAGAGILYGLTPHQAHASLGVTRVHRDMGLGQAFGVEFMITFLLVFTVFANLEPKRIDMGSRSLAMGLAIVLGHLFAFNYTGASMNPARSLGPALVMNSWRDHWVYWIGPLLGGIIGGFTYEYTHDSSNQLQTFRRSFRRRNSSMKRMRCSNSTNSTVSTEMAFTPTSEDMKI